jgi:hypothetical protein
MPCPICHRRKPKRYCPAKGEKICAVCCGVEREVSIDCPADCAYLIAARRYDAEHRVPLPAEQYPYPDVEFSPDLVPERQPAVSGLAYAILKAAQESREMVDRDALEALAALAETFRTLGSGIYYERPPDASQPRALYGRLAQFLQEYKKEEAQHAGWARLKDSEVFFLLVFLLRVGRHQTNGRPRSRAFLDFLRGQFPRAAQTEREASRIITP